MRRLLSLALIAAAGLCLTACEDGDFTWVAEAKRKEALKAKWARDGHREWLRIRAAKKERLDYAWNLQIVKMCRNEPNTATRYVLRGRDGRLWISEQRNPGRTASNGGYETYGEGEARWLPETYMDPIAPGINAKDVCL